MKNIMNKEENELKLDVYLDKEIDIRQIPPNVLTALLSGLELNIARYYNKKRKKH